MDYLSAYDTALMYAHAFRILFLKHIESRKTNDYKDFSLIIPAMTMGGFACELFFKSLLNCKNKGHSLCKLYSELNVDDAIVVEETVVSCMQIKKDKINYSCCDFRNDLDKHDKIFIELRYFYEGKMITYYNVDFIEVLVSVLQVCCEQKFGKRPTKTEKDN